MRDSDPGADHTALLQELFGAAPRAWYVLDADMRVITLNRSAAALHCLPGQDALGRRLADVAPGFPADEITELAAEVLATGARVTNRMIRGGVGPRTDERRDDGPVVVLTLTLYRLEAGTGTQAGRSRAVAVSVEDITEQAASADRLAILHTAQQTIGSTLDIAATAQELVDVTVPRFADASTVDVLDETWRAGPEHHGGVSPDHPLRRAAYRTRSGGELPVYVGRLNTFGYSTPFSQSLADIRPRLITALREDEPWLAANPAFGALLRSYGVHSLMVVPMAVHDAVLGLTVHYRNARAEPFDEADLDLAERLADRTALSIDKARSYARERTVATALQRYLLPRQPPRSPPSTPPTCTYRAGPAATGTT